MGDLATLKSGFSPGDKLIPQQMFRDLLIPCVRDIPFILGCCYFTLVRLHNVNIHPRIFVKNSTNLLMFLHENDGC